MDTPSTLSPTSPKPPIKLIEHTRYCTICTHMEKHAQKNSLYHWIGMMMRRKKKTELKMKRKIKIMRRRCPKSAPDSLTLQASKPSITKYFGKRSSITPVMNALEEEHRFDTIVTPREHEDQNEDTLEDID